MPGVQSLTRTLPGDTFGFAAPRPPPTTVVSGASLTEVHGGNASQRKRDGSSGGEWMIGAVIRFVTTPESFPFEFGLG